MLFGLQSKASVDDPVPATRSTSFHTRVTVIPGPPIDFEGNHVNGKTCDRFIYLSWGLAGGDEPFAMFARAKIKVAHIRADLLEQAMVDELTLVCELEATNAKGQPASGTIKVPAVSWRTELRA